MSSPEVTDHIQHSHSWEDVISTVSHKIPRIL
jgi:hypothetical protein